MSAKTRIFTAIFKKRTNTIKCKLTTVDSELYTYAYYLLKGRLNILGITKKHSIITISNRCSTITLTEHDWKMLDKAKPLVSKVLYRFQETKGLNLFEDTDRKINLI